MKKIIFLFLISFCAYSNELIQAQDASGYAYIEPLVESEHGSHVIKFAYFGQQLPSVVLSTPDGDIVPEIKTTQTGSKIFGRIYVPSNIDYQDIYDVRVNGYSTQWNGAYNHD